MRKSFRIATVAVLAVFLCAAAAQAGELVGRPAPPINAKEWLNVKKPLTLKGLKGKIVFLLFTATW